MNIITTDRLSLRTALNHDIDILYELVFSDPEVMAQAFLGKTFTKEESKTFFATKFDHIGTGKQLGILTLKQSNEIIGFAGLLETSILGQTDYEIGFVLGENYWGKGYASEIAHAQIEFGLGLLKCERLLGLVAPQNKGSVLVINKIGMSYHSSVEIEERGLRDVYIIENK